MILDTEAGQFHPAPSPERSRSAVCASVSMIAKQRKQPDLQPNLSGTGRGMGKDFYFKLPHVPHEAEDVFDLLVGRENTLKYLLPAVRALLGFNVHACVFDKC